MPVLSTRGAEVGACNICGSVGPLTVDHTPPKGCVRPTAMELVHATARVDAGKATKAKANHGVAYRTLCARCNNKMLGARYDPALIDFVNNISRLLASELVLPETMAIHAQPALIMRSVLGHLAAVGVDRFLKNAENDKWRDYFLDDALPPPAGMRFYYWLYPYRRQALIRDAGVVDIRAGVGRANFWMMKFYPLAFAIFHADSTLQLPLRDLATYPVSAPTDAHDVMIDLRTIPHELTLEAPTTTQGILYGRDSVVANRRPPRGVVIKI